MEELCLCLHIQYVQFRIEDEHGHGDPMVSPSLQNTQPPPKFFSPNPTNYISDFKVFIQTWLQDLCVPPRLCFWYLSDFALMGCSLFAFYISIRKTQMGIWISHLYFCISCLKWLIYDSLIRILVFGNGFFFLRSSLVSYLFSKF